MWGEDGEKTKKIPKCLSWTPSGCPILWDRYIGVCDFFGLGYTNFKVSRARI